MLCKKCGLDNLSGGDFCNSCDNTLALSSPPASNNIKLGKMRKCPACGTGVKAFETACSACRHEFSDIEASATIQSLFRQIREIESLYGANELEKAARQKASLIRNFPIPNSRNELLELLYFIQPKLNDTSYSEPNYNDWLVKFSEVVARAKSAYRNEVRMLTEISLIEKGAELSNFGKYLRIIHEAKNNYFNYLKYHPVKSFLTTIFVIIFALFIIAVVFDPSKAEDAAEKRDEGLPFCAPEEPGIIYSYRLNRDIEKNAENQMIRINTAISNARKLSSEGKKLEALDILGSIEYKRCTFEFNSGEKDHMDNFYKKKNDAIYEIK